MDDRWSGRHVLVIPGAQRGPFTPLPMYAADVAEWGGATIHHMWWEHAGPGGESRYGLEERMPLARAEVRSTVDALAPKRPLLIGKSMGTQGAEAAADLGLPAIWLTPLLAQYSIADGLRRATAPFLLVGGTRDPFWDGDLARELTPHVFEVPDADHGLYVPGPVRDSIPVLGDMVDAVHDFLEEVAWRS